MSVMDATKFLGTLLFVISECLMNCESGWYSRTWQTTTSYSDSRLWDIGRAPCKGDRIILQNSEATIQLPDSGTSLRELVLPSYTDLILPKNGLVQFTGRKEFPNCDGQDIILKTVQPSRWTDYRNWDGWNAATPDEERIPCTKDAVRFVSGSIYNIIMPNYYTKIASLEVNGMIVSNVGYSVADGGPTPFKTPEGYNAYLDIAGYPCDASEWCLCNNGFLHSQICSAVACPEPLCQQPVQPHGFCCPICGVYFLLENTPHNKTHLTDQINSFLGNNNIVWHASKVGRNVQVVLVESGEYTGTVAGVAEALKNFLARSGLRWTTKEFHTSGHVLYPVSFGRIVGYFFSLMIAAALTLAAILVFYSHDWTWVTFSPLEGRPFVFARFENQTEEVLVASEERQQTNTLHPRTFDNPLYEASRLDHENTVVETPEDPIMN